MDPGLAALNTGWLMLELAIGVRRRLTDADCTAGTLAWQSDSRTLVYTSDRDHGVGQTALYRVSRERP